MMGKVAQVSLIPIGDKLLSGVPTRTIICEDKIRVKSYAPKNISIGISTENLENFEDGYIFNLTSSLKSYSEHYVPDTKVWRPFVVKGCQLKFIGSSYEIVGKFARINQKFKLTGNPKGEFHFFCDNWNVRFRDQFFTREDILSFYYGKEIRVKFLTRTVKLDKLETFIPVHKGMSVHLIVDKSRGEIKNFNNDIIRREQINFGHSFISLGSPMIIECLKIKDNLKLTETLDYLYRNYSNVVENRKIHLVPIKNGILFKSFLIQEPFSQAKVITEDIYLFKIKIDKELQIKVADNCPVSCSTIKNDDYFICTVELKCPCPIILLEKSDTELLLKCP